MSFVFLVVMFLGSGCIQAAHRNHAKQIEAAQPQKPNKIDYWEEKP